MKAKILAAAAAVISGSVLLVACGKVEDGKITTKQPQTTVSSVVTTTEQGIKDEMSSLAGDMSEGLSEAGSEIKKGLTRLYE